jgi:hypothetical protein
MFDAATGSCCDPAASVSQAQLSPVEFWGIIIAAAAGVAGVLAAIYAIVQNHRANKDAAQRDERMTETLDSMAQDMDRLAGITEETATRAPLPGLAFLIDGEPSPSLGFKPQVPRQVDTEAVLAAALQYAQASRPVIAPKPYLYVMGRPTQADVNEYDAKVTRYIDRLRPKLAERDEWERDQARLIVIRLRLTNDGAIPLEDGRVVIRTPEGLTPREGVPRPPELPEVPVFRSRYDYLFPAAETLHSLHPESPWLVTSGFHPKTSDTAEWEAGDVQHGGYLDSRPLVLASEGAGEFTLEWRVHADNLGQPQMGTLDVVVDAADSTPPQLLTTLDDVGLGEEQYEDEED